MSKRDSKEHAENEKVTEQPVEPTATADNMADEAQISEAVEEEQAGFEAVVSELNLKVADLNDKHLRLSAEFDNYRKRTLKEKMELTKTAGEGILKAILPVVDDFERAMAHIDDAKDLQAVKDGVTLIYNKFNEFLNNQGLKAIEAKDAPFDTDLHEAITKIPVPSEQMKGKVIDCVEKGYTLNDKVIRFSKVVVGI
jgi:molecular chaperone GrpE